MPAVCCWPQVLVAVGETVWVIDDDGATDQALPAGCGGVASMAVSPNGAFLAVACLDGKLRVMQSGEQRLAEEPGMSARQQSGVAACQERWHACPTLLQQLCARSTAVSVWYRPDVPGSRGMQGRICMSETRLVPHTLFYAALQTSASS